VRLIVNDQKIADPLFAYGPAHEQTMGRWTFTAGPTAPAGFEQNWIPTVPGKNWFAYFRFYQPTEPYFDRSWPLPDFERV
jgi:hypothetical protein